MSAIAGLGTNDIWRHGLGAQAPYFNQFGDLFKTAWLRLLWKNGFPDQDPNNFVPAAVTEANELIERFRHLGNGNPVNDHFYRSTDTVSSSGFYDGRDDLVPWATHTLNLDETRQGPYSRTKHLWNGQIDDGMPRRDDFFDKAAEFFLPDWRANPACKIHINCAAGASRAPSMAYFFVRATTSLSVLEAKATVYAANSVRNRNISITYCRDAERALKRLGLREDTWTIPE